MYVKERNKCHECKRMKFWALENSKEKFELLILPLM